MEEQRLFVGNLPPEVSENDLKKLFKKFKLSSIELKRKNVLGGESVFAYINIDKNLADKCITHLRNYEWKGYELKIEKAKESFLDRLKRERIQRDEKLGSNSVSINPPVQNESDNFPNKKIIFDSEETKLDDMSDSSVENNQSNILRRRNLLMFEGTNSVNYNVSTVEVTKEKKSFHGDPSTGKNSQKIDIECSMKRFEEFSSVWNDNADADSFHFGNSNSFNQSYANESRNNKNNKKVEIINSKYSGEMKRKTALEEKWSSINERKRLINAALKNINSSWEGEMKSNSKPKESRKLSETQNKVILFGNDSSEEESFEPNFEVKQYLEGEKGIKRLNLKAKLANDDRFQIDERFFDDNETSTASAKNSQENRIVIKPMERYDPLKSVSEKNEQSQKQQNKEKKTKKKNNKDQKQIEENKRVETIKPEVSKEKHYSISDNLKEAFKKNDTSSFSLSAMFDEQLKQSKNDHNESVLEEIPSKKLKFVQNPLDEAASSEEEENIYDKEEAPLDILPTIVPPEKVLNKCGIWGETFFFKAEDSRLKEAESFYRSCKEPEKVDFGKKRSELRSIVRKKIQNSRRDRKLFKQKLGSKINKSKFKMRLKKISS